MREILFRGKRIDNGEWVEGFLLKECNYATCSWNLAIEYKTDRFGKFAYDVAEIIPEGISEFTGLTDKNGKKIFEGDICKDKHNELWEVKFGQYGDCSDGMQVGFHYSKQRTFANGSIGEELFCMLCSTYHPEAFEVIGNIHDNPELLENP